MSQRAHLASLPMTESPAPHVLLFPLPLQGPVNSMLKLAELLCLAGINVTFLLTDDIHRRLSRHTDLAARFTFYPDLRIRVIPDGLPENHPRGDKFIELVESMRVNTKPLFKEMLRSESESSRFSCILSDGIMGFPCEVASELGIPYFYVRTISAACLWIFCQIPKLIESGEIPFQGNDMDEAVKSVPGMEPYLRRRDLPSFCRSADVSNPHIQLYKTEKEQLPRANGLILNTFEELEQPILHEFRSVCPNIYSIGPLHAHLKSKLAEKPESPPENSNSLWEEDRTCLKWLDSQPPKSVIYVSFGSLTVLTQDELMEFWHGLINSNHRFLWVIRPNSVPLDPQMRDELHSTSRGYIVGWAPQEEVLRHDAVGGFLTHSGWNSTLESVFEGVPMICWPYFIDQQINSRLVEVWKLGLDMKDSCDRRGIERSVKEVMELRRDEFQRRSAEMAAAAKKCLSDGGSSDLNFKRLVKDIKSFSIK